MYKLSQFIDSHMIITILTSIGLVMLLIGIFFFTYATRVEEEIIKINTNIIVDDLLDVVVPLLNKNTKMKIATSLIYPNMEEEDKHVTEKNRKITEEAINILGIIAGVTIVLSLIISFFTKNNYLHIIGLNIIILIFVGLTEYAFLNILPKKFIAADTNHVRYLILSNLDNKLGITI
jgi:hypothetical protein